MPGTISQYDISWTSDSSGAASVAVNMIVSSMVQRIVIAPGSGDEQPTNAYDMTLTDKHGVDVLKGQGADLSNALVKDCWASIEDQSGNGMPITIGGKLTLTVANAGNAKKGVVTLYLKV